MKISIIGMSNSGKTYWSKKLEKMGFRYFGCDDFIEKKLRKELKRLGYSGINDVAKWIGQPYEERYKINSQRYLKIEKQTVEEILSHLNNELVNNKRIVIDTTGSVIYLGEKIMGLFKKFTTIINLDTPVSIREQMYQNYLKNPKPVIWGDSFKIEKGQSRSEALAMCYPKLLTFRNEKYRNYADVTANYFLLRSENFTAEKFLKLFQDKK